MPSDGEMYVYSDHIAVETNGASALKGYEDGWDFVQGCQLRAREPHGIGVQWIAPMQMAQVAAGHRWCSVCGDVRPFSYFDVLEWDQRGRATEWDTAGKPMAWDGLPFPVRWNDECRQCINSRDPKLAKEKFCSSCKVMHPRADFGDDSDYADGKYPSCYESERKRQTAGYAREVWLNEERQVRHYDSRVRTG